MFGLSRSGTAPQGVTAIACDLSDDAAIERAFGAIAAQGGRVDALVNAAGISLPAQSAESELARFRATVATDPIRGFPGNPGYVAAKAGLAGLTRALAADYGPDGIRVNALAPGYVATEMTAKSFADPAMHEDRRRHTMLGRWGQPADMVGAAVFLASEASAYVTGQELFVDGGWTAKGLAISSDSKS